MMWFQSGKHGFISKITLICENVNYLVIFLINLELRLYQTFPITLVPFLCDRMK